MKPAKGVDFITRSYYRVPHTIGYHETNKMRQRDFLVYAKAPRFRSNPGVMTCAQVRGDQVVMSIVNIPLCS